MMGMFIVYLKNLKFVDCDYVIMMYQWVVYLGIYCFDLMIMFDFNMFSMNLWVFLVIFYMVVKIGDCVCICLGNLLMDQYLIYLYGYLFKVIVMDGGLIFELGQWLMIIVFVFVGVMCDIEFKVDVFGDWVFYCYKMYYMMNVMGYGIFNIFGVDQSDLEVKI